MGVFASASTANGDQAPVRTLPSNAPTEIRQPLGITVDFTRN